MRTDLPATWFRLYAEFATDPKVQMLSEIDQRRFLMLMCLRCCNGAVTLLETEIAFQLRISDAEWQTTKNVLYKKGLIDFDNKPVKWESRQFDSDTSNARVAKHRALQKEKQPNKRSGAVTLPKRKSNAPETETETETENIKKGNSATRLPLDWVLPENLKEWAINARPDLDPEKVAEKFKDFWIAKPGKAGTKLDWAATWRNWVREQRAEKSQFNLSNVESFRERDQRAKREQMARDFPNLVSPQEENHGPSLALG